MTDQQSQTLSTLHAIRVRNLATIESMQAAIDRSNRTIQILSRDRDAAWHEGIVPKCRDQHED